MVVSLGDIMKKIYKCSLLLFISLVAVTGWTAPWAGRGPVYEADAQNSKYVPVEDLSVLPALLQEKPFKISLWIENEKKGEFERFSNMVRQVYQGWFDNAVYFIEKSGREQEFQDVLPYLRKDLPIEVVRYEEKETADLKVLIHSTLKNMHQFFYEEDGEDRGEILGAYSDEKKRFNITKQASLAKPKYVFQYLVGLSLGFEGQGFCDRSCGDPVYSSDSVYNVMNASPKLTCDDADGIVNMIDRELNLRRGGESGWKSLCSDSEQYYSAGMSTKTNRYRSSHVADDSLVIEEFENGKKIDTLAFKFTKDTVDPFSFVEEEEVLKRDSAGYPVLLKGKNGELVYYIRMYDRIEKIVTKNGEMLSYMYTLPLSGQLLGLIKKFPIEGKVATLQATMTFKEHPLTAAYIYPDGEKGLDLIYFTKKGKVQASERYFGDWYILHEPPVLDRPYVSPLEVDERIQESLIKQRLFEWGQKWPEHLETPLRNKDI